MKTGAPGAFGAQLKALREAAGFTQEELATVAGISVHAVGALERGERRRPHPDTVRALAGALDLTGATREALVGSARQPVRQAIDDQADALPIPITGILGREHDVHMLRQWLVEPSIRLVTLVGPGGVGKTRLALEVARAIGAVGSTRVVFVSLSATPSSAFVASAVAEAFGLSEVTMYELPKRLRLVCQDQPTILVLDNFEHVLDAAPLVADLLTSVSALQMLITSRAALHLRGEREYVVGPLALDASADAVMPGGDGLAPALRLFVERVQNVQPDFQLTPANEPTVGAICRRLDALPLAIELAAPWIRVLTVEELLRRLERDVLLSTVTPRDLPERQQTMNTTVAWSYRLLDAGEQHAFRRFGALPGLFRIDAAAAVLSGRTARAGDADQALAAAASLIDKSLLQRPRASIAGLSPLYRMLDTVRAYAALELNASGDRADAMDGLVRYCAIEAAVAAEGLIGPAQVEWLDRVREDLENYRAVLTYLIEHGRAVEATDIAWSLKYFWLVRGHAIEGLRWYEEILGLPDLPAAAESRALLGAAQMWWTQGQLGRARVGLARVLELAADAGDLAIVAQAEHIAGHIEHAVGARDAAADLFDRSLEKFRALAIPSGIGTVLSGTAVLALATGDTARAESLLDEATSVLRHAGPWFLTWALYVRAILAVRRGRPDEAIVLMGESLARIRELRDNFAFVYALVPLASAAVRLGNHTLAARLLGARDAVTERTGVTVADRSVQDLEEEAGREARAHLGPESWAESYAAGRRASIESLLEDIGQVESV